MSYENHLDINVFTDVYLFLKWDLGGVKKNIFMGITSIA